MKEVLLHVVPVILADNYPAIAAIFPHGDFLAACAGWVSPSMAPFSPIQMLPSILSPFASAHIHLLSTQTYRQGDVVLCCGAGHQNRIGKSQMREEGGRCLRFFPSFAVLLFVTTLPAQERGLASPPMALPSDEEPQNPPTPPVPQLSATQNSANIPRKPLRTSRRPQHQPPTPMSSRLIHSQNASSASCPISVP